MKLPSGFDGFIGNPRAVEILRRAVALDRLPHALIFAGPSGVGKRTLAMLLAQLLNCHAPAGRRPCGECRSCRKIAGRSHPDVRLIEAEGAFIKIEQVRQLIAEIAYQPFEGRCRVVILDEAEQMRAEAANSLLKTLEEPPSRTVMILVTSSPYLLLETVRSRSRMLHFGGIPEDRIERHLVEQEGWDPRTAHLAAALSRGSLARALAFDAAAHDESLSQARRFVALLLARGGFAEASQIAAAAAKDRDRFETWLDAVQSVLRGLYYARTAPDRCRGDEGLEGPAEAASAPALAYAVRSLERLRQGLQFNINRQAAAEALFLDLQERILKP